GGDAMREQGMTTARLAAFSDGVIAVIVTVMVLELKAPDARGDADRPGGAAARVRADLPCPGPRPAASGRQMASVLQVSFRNGIAGTAVPVAIL
ncbi:MAG: TMEM175 family protein, partial [Acetobacteraceae bacterium]